MLITLPDFVAALIAALERHKVPDSSFVAEACAFLEACGYPGLVQLQEALADDTRQLALVKDVIGMDLKNVSCVFLARQLGDYAAKNGRVFLRNVRHGLYLVPDSVASNYGIGCPVDPSFALGGERAKNPYEDKWAIALQDGITVDDGVWGKVIAP